MNDYLAKSAAAQCVGAAYIGVTSAAQQLNAYPAAAPIKLTAIEDAVSQVELMRQQINLIGMDVAAFLDRAAGGCLNDNPPEKQASPLPSGQLPRLIMNLSELKYQINTLGERVSKLSQIA